MELGSKSILKIVKDQKINNLILYINDSYNNSVYPQSENSEEFISYLSDVSDGLINMYNAINNLYEPLATINEFLTSGNLVNLTDFLSELEKQMQIFYVRLKSFYDTLVILIERILLLRIRSNRNMKSFNEELGKRNHNIWSLLESLRQNYRNFDQGNRNKIIHESSFFDEDIHGFYTWSIIRKKPSEENLSSKLITQREILLRKKIVALDNVTAEAFSILSEIFDLLEKEYYLNEKKLQ